MKKITFLTLMAACLAVIGMVGCGSDSDPTASNLIVGDTSSETFQFVSDSIGYMSQDMAGNGLDLSFELLDLQFPSSSTSKIGQPNKAAGDTVIVVTNQYTYSNGWHIFDFRATFIDFDDTTIVEGIDSIQTLINNEPVQNPDTVDINGLKVRAQYAFDNNNFGSGVGHQSFDLTATSFDSLGVVTINGITHDTLTAHFIESLDSCNLDMNNTLSINNVTFQFDVGEECPTSGSIVANQNISLSCIGSGASHLDSLNIDGSWTVTVTFNGATETISFTDGTTTWTVTEDCAPGTVGAAMTAFYYKEQN